MNTLWSKRYSTTAERMRSSTIRELLKLTESPEIISFAGGLPGAEAFPISTFREAADLVLARHGAEALQYGTTEGYMRLREMIVRHTRRYGIVIEPDNVLITTGSQQALDLIGRVFLNPGDRVLTERPTYLGALQAWNAYDARYVTVEIDEDGMHVDRLDAALRAGPKFIYVLPNFQNPTGVTLSLERRRYLVERADHYGIPIVEDDPYGQLRYDGEHLPPLVSIDSQARGDHTYGGNVLYLSTFSKTLAPGLRLGWVVAPTDVIAKLVAAKQGTDLHTSTLVQFITEEIAGGGFLDDHVVLIRDLYRRRRDAMIEAMERHFPEGVAWTRPAGGLFLWVVLPSDIDAEEVLRLAVIEKVAFVPGTPFFPEHPMRNTMRLNFSYAEPAKIEEGIRRLGAVLHRMLPSHQEGPHTRSTLA